MLLSQVRDLAPNVAVGLELSAGVPVTRSIAVFSRHRHFFSHFRPFLPLDFSSFFRLFFPF